MIALTRAKMEHWADLFAWRNDPDTRAASLTTEVVPLDAHLKWLKAALQNESIELLVFRDPVPGCLIGTGRIDWEGKAAELSLTVDRRHRGEGYGTQMIRELVRLAQAKHPSAIRAKVRVENFGSLRAFASCGFIVKKVKGDVAELGYESAP